MKTILQNIRPLSAPAAALLLLLAGGASVQAQSLTDSLAGSPPPLRSVSAAPHRHAAKAAAGNVSAPRPHHHKRSSDAVTRAVAAPVPAHHRAHPKSSIEAVTAVKAEVKDTAASLAHAKKLRVESARKAAHKAAIAAAAAAVVKAPAAPMTLTIQQAPPAKTESAPASTSVVAPPPAQSAPKSTPIPVSQPVMPPVAAVPHHTIKVAAPAVSIDDMTRDGSAARQNNNTADGNSLNIGGAVLRAVLALIFVLALVVWVVYALRKKGYGVSRDDYSAPVGSSAGTPIRSAVRGGGSWRLAKESPTYVAPAAARLNSMDDLEVLSHRLLPGTTSSLYKVRIDDRVLLLGCSPDGALSVLTEWDVETKPATDETFETLLNEMEADTGEYPFARTSGLNGTAERIGQTVKRLSSIGGAGKSFRKSA